MDAGTFISTPYRYALRLICLFFGYSAPDFTHIFFIFGSADALPLFICIRFAGCFALVAPLHSASLRYITAPRLLTAYPRATTPPLHYAFAPLRFRSLAFARCCSKLHIYSTASTSLARYYIYAAFFIWNNKN